MEYRSERQFGRLEKRLDTAPTLGGSLPKFGVPESAPYPITYVEANEANRPFRINSTTPKMAKNEASPNPTEAKSQRSKSLRISKRLSDKPN